MRTYLAHLKKNPKDSIKKICVWKPKVYANKTKTKEEKLLKDVLSEQIFTEPLINILMVYLSNLKKKKNVKSTMRLEIKNIRWNYKK